MKIHNLLFAGLLMIPNLNAFAETTKTPPPTEPQKVEKTWLIEDEKNTIQTFNSSADSVVFVNTKTLVRNDFTMDVYEVPSGAGTGFIWDKNGYIVTNYHVIENHSKNQPVSVTLKDGRTLEAKIVGYEPHRDIAVLKLKDNKNLPLGFSEKLADSSDIQVGQKTIAIGNPFELSHTLTTGVVSAIGRSVPSPVPGISNRDMIQTDAAINPGNSGGPLMDSRGFLVGMNTSIYSQSGSSAGVGFAVPSNVIKRIVAQLIKTGKISQPGFGIQLVPERLARYLGVKEGVVIGGFIENQRSAAASAGLRGSTMRRNGTPELGDIILTIDGKKVNDRDDMYSAIESKAVGDNVKVEYLRRGKKATVDVILQEIKE